MSQFDLSPVKCFHPRLVTNKYNGRSYFVRCGKCDACLLTKSYELTSRVEAECKAHRFSFFFTLTYDNAHIPAFVVKSDSLGDYLFSSSAYHAQKKRDIYFTDNGSLPTQMKFVQNDSSDALRIGHLNKYDIQCFLKRLRINIDRKLNLSKNEKKIRFFVCGEYGENTFRPHYHGIIWTDSQELADSLPVLIVESWPLAHKSQTEGQISLVQSNASQYVAAYVNGVSHLPRYLQLPETRPFYLASKNPAVGYYGKDSLEIQTAVSRQLFTIPRLDETTREVVNDEIPAYLASRFFPRCRNFSELNSFQRVTVYSEAFELARKKALKGSRIFVIGDLSRPSKRYAATSLDYVRSCLKPFQAAFNGTLKCKDLMLKSRRIFLACADFCKKFNCTVDWFVHLVDRLGVHREMLKLKLQIQNYNEYVKRRQWSLIRFLYPENYDKASFSYIGNSGPMYVSDSFFNKDWSVRDSIVSRIRASWDFYACACEPCTSKKFSFIDSSVGQLFRNFVSSEFTKRTKFKRINDSGICPDKFNNIY